MDIRVIESLIQATITTGLGILWGKRLGRLFEKHRCTLLLKEAYKKRQSGSIGWVLWSVYFDANTLVPDHVFFPHFARALHEDGEIDRNSFGSEP